MCVYAKRKRKFQNQQDTGRSSGLWYGFLVGRSDWYAQSILLFPSYLETVGLPICEAMSVGAPVLLSDCLYARDVAKEYANARYFVKDNAAALAQLMEVCIVKRQDNGGAR